MVNMICELLYLKNLPFKSIKIFVIFIVPFNFCLFYLIQCICANIFSHKFFSPDTASTLLSFLHSVAISMQRFFSRETSLFYFTFDQRHKQKVKSQNYQTPCKIRNGKSLIKWQHQKVKHIKQTNCNFADLVQTFSYVKTTYYSRRQYQYWSFLFLMININK